MMFRSPLPLLLIALVAAAVSAVLIYLLRPALQQYALARPNARSSHLLPTPQGAGIAVIAATLLVAGSFIAFMRLPIPQLLFGATLFIALVGVADDIRSIAVLPRLLLQAAAVALIVFTLSPDLRLVPELPLGIERGLIFLGALWFVNLVNFMDGLDWITAAEVVPMAGALAIFGFLGVLPAPTTIITAALFGAMIGFAPFNRPVAKVFLGDVGSLSIGLLLGSCLLELAYRQHLTAALLLPLYYLADSTVTLLARLVRGEPFWAAHRSHFYQRATDHGFTVLAVVGDVFVLNLLLAGLAIGTTVIQSRLVVLVSWLASCLAVGLVMYRFSRPRPPR